MDTCRGKKRLQPPTHTLLLDCECFWHYEQIRIRLCIYYVHISIWMRERIKLVTFLVHIPRVFSFKWSYTKHMCDMQHDPWDVNSPINSLDAVSRPPHSKCNASATNTSVHTYVIFHYWLNGWLVTLFTFYVKKMLGLTNDEAGWKYCRNQRGFKDTSWWSMVLLQNIAVNNLLKTTLNTNTIN